MQLQTWQNIKSCVFPHQVVRFTFNSRDRASTRRILHSSCHILHSSHANLTSSETWPVTHQAGSDTIQDGVNIIQEGRRCFLISRQAFLDKRPAFPALSHSDVCGSLNSPPWLGKRSPWKISFGELFAWRKANPPPIKILLPTKLSKVPKRN